MRALGPDQQRIQLRVLALERRDAGCGVGGVSGLLGERTRRGRDHERDGDDQTPACGYRVTVTFW